MFKSPRSLSLATLFVALLAPAASAFAATYKVGAFSVTISDSIPASEKIRGAIVTSRWSPMLMESKGKTEFDAFVVKERLATITTGFADRDLSMNEIKAEYQALVTAFDTLADRFGRPELRSAGFIFQGCSVHGARSMSEGLGNPDRTIAAISFCGRDYALFNLVPSFTAFMPALSFPHLQVSNGGDLDRVMWNDATTRQVRDEARGLWTSSLHPKLGHCQAAADGVGYELLWLREAIKARVPATIPDGAYTLKKLTDATSWLGDYSPARSTNGSSVWGTGYKFNNATVFAASTVPADEVSEHIWFPSRVAAEEWKHYADTGTCCLGVTDPEPQPDPDPVCGDGTCTDDSESCGNCPSDCGCATGNHCAANQCVEDDVTTPTDPGEPSDPGTPGEPSDPGTPGEPSDPGTPGEPSDPGTPSEPDDSGDDGTVTPADPASPTNKSCNAAGAGTLAALVGLLPLLRRRRETRTKGM